MRTEESDEEPSIPASLLTKLYDATGTKLCSHKGYIMFYVNEDGKPACLGKFDNDATEMALYSSAKEMLKNNK